MYGVTAAAELGIVMTSNEHSFYERTKSSQCRHNYDHHPTYEVPCPSTDDGSCQELKIVTRNRP